MAFWLSDASCWKEVRLSRYRYRDWFCNLLVFLDSDSIQTGLASLKAGALEQMQCDY